MKVSQRHLFGRRKGPRTEAFKQSRDWECLQVCAVGLATDSLFQLEKRHLLSRRLRFLTYSVGQSTWVILNLPSDTDSPWQFVKETVSSVVCMGPQQLHLGALLDTCLELSCTWDSLASPCQLSLPDQCLLSPLNCFGNCRQDGSQLLTPPGTSQTPLAEEPNPSLS